MKALWILGLVVVLGAGAWWYSKRAPEHPLRAVRRPLRGQTDFAETEYRFPLTPPSAWR